VIEAGGQGRQTHTLLRQAVLQSRPLRPERRKIAMLENGERLEMALLQLDMQGQLYVWVGPQNQRDGGPITPLESGGGVIYGAAHGLDSANLRGRWPSVNGQFLSGGRLRRR